MSAEPEPGAAGAPSTDTELGFLRGLLAQQQEVQQKQQRAIAQQALEQQLAQARAAAPAAVSQPAQPRAETVRSKPIKPVRSKDTAVVRGETIDRAAIGIMRYGALVLLLISFLGLVVALNGGWAPIIAA